MVATEKLCDVRDTRQEQYEETRKGSYRLAVISTHPIQYQCPLFRKLAARPEIDLTVYFCSDHGVKVSKDRQFGASFKWDIPLLEGFRYQFLENWSFGTRSGRLKCFNPQAPRLLRKGAFDAVWIFGWRHATQWMALAGRTPIFLLSESPWNQEQRKPKWKRALKAPFLQALFKRISAFLYIGRENREFYRHMGVPEERLFFCPYAVDNDRFIEGYQRLRPQREQLRLEMGIKPDEVVILFSGKLIEKKKPLDLLNAFARLNDRRAVLMYVGDGHLREQIEASVAQQGIENVRLVGFKNQSELPKYYTVADVFVLPSVDGETWGLVVNEAMCFGLPVIVSDLPGSGADLVQEGENGFRFPAQDVEKLRQCLHTLVNDAALRQRMGERAAALIHEWGYDKDVEGILAALEAVQSTKGRRGEASVCATSRGNGKE